MAKREVAGPVSLVEMGTFRLDGSWDPEASERTSAYRLVERCIELRRRHRMTPASVAQYITNGPFPTLLGTGLRFWLERDWKEGDAGPDGPREDPWIGLHCSTSAAQAIQSPQFDKR